MKSLALIALSALLSATAWAQYPSKPITIVVPYPPGGSNDVFARLVAKEMAEMLKQPVLVDNKPGASGSLGTAMVTKAAPDGHTLVAVSSSMTTNAAIQPKAGFDPEKDLAPVAFFAEGPFIVAVNNNFAAKTPSELIALIKQKPGMFNYATSGSGSVNHFATESLKVMAGDLAITHVPYRGLAPAITDVVGGQVELIIGSGPSLMPMVRAGRLRALGITSPQKSAIAPDLPTMAGAVPGYQFSLWWGLFAPAGTPSNIVNTLNQAVNQALLKPALKTQIFNEGAEVKATTPAELGARVSTDLQRWRALAKQQNIVAD